MDRFRDLQREHEGLRGSPFDYGAHERHRARLNALIQALRRWRADAPGIAPAEVQNLDD